MKRKKAAALRKFGLELVGNVPWGTHLCQFYDTKEDLINILVPYFIEGLRNNEFCMWITSPPLEAEEAKRALKKSMPEIDQYIEKGQIEILPYTEWYLLGGSFNSNRVLRDWVKKEKAALDSGFDGLRLTGNTFWLERNGWKAFTEYEEQINNTIGQHKMIAVCTYSLDRCNANEVIDVVKNHEFALIKRSGKWERVESAETKKVRQAEDDLRSAALFPEQNPSAVLRVARDGKLLYANKSSAPLLGLWKCKNAQRVPEQIRQQVTRALDTKKITELEVLYASVIYLLVITPITQYDYANIYGSDVTERKKAEQALQESEERFRVIAETSPAQISVSRVSDGVILFTNSAYDRAFGFSRGELVGSLAPNLYVNPEDRKKLIDSLKRQGFVKDYEIRVKRKDGTPFWVSTSVAYIRFSGEEALLGASFDITERKKVETALRERENDLNRAQAVANTGSWRLDMRRNQLLWSDETYRMFGIPKGTLMTYETFLDAIHPDDKDYVDQKWKEAFRGASYDIEHRIVVNGKVKWVRERAELEFDEDGTILGGFGTVQDITERKQMQAKLQEYTTSLKHLVEKRTEQVTNERKRLYGILENLPVMICLLTPDHHVAFANRSFRERFGESQGRHCYDYCFGNKEPCNFCESYKPLETGQPHHWEVQAPDGSVIDAYDYPFTDSDGSNLILEMDIDITQQKRAQQHVQAAALYARSLIEASLDPLVTISAEGKITDVNNATEIATGYLRDQLIGRDFSDYFTEPEKARAGYKKVFAEGLVKDYPLAIMHKSGKTIDVLYNASIYRNAQGEIQGVFAAARDITEQKKAEEKSKESAKKLQDAERLAAIGATAGMVGHDIRNPLQVIIGDVYLAKMDSASLPDSEEKKSLQESLCTIEKQTEYINKIVLDLQDFAKPLSPHAEETNIETIINELLIRNGVPNNIQTDAKVDADAKMMMADSAYMKRIIGNLVSNAVQALPNGGKLNLRAYREASDIIITVEDTGVGIPEEAKPKLFQPLFTTKSKGQGFGLSVVKRLTEALNGTVTFESQEGKGTKFTLRFPSPC